MPKIFKNGKITFLIDGQAGSSGKSRTASYILEKHKGEYTFACNTFSANAAHWVKKRDGRQFLYKALNSCVYDSSLYERMFIGSGAGFELATFFQEIEENNVPSGKVKISPLAVVIQNIDENYEKGLSGFDGEVVENHDGTMATGSTSSGVGAAAARRLLRRPSTKLAKDVPELKSFISPVTEEIMTRLERGESGFQEIAQGFQLSLMHPTFYPFTTYRNVTVSQALSDMFLPTKYAGPVIINFRTFPIRISSNKYIGTDGKHLTWDEIQAGVPHKVYVGNSGHWYPDQTELSWDDVRKISETPWQISELTSKTKLPRRVATFSKINLNESIRYNDTGEGIFLTLNFLDYVDFQIRGISDKDKLTIKVKNWVDENFGHHQHKLWLLGTGPMTEDCIDLL